LSDACADVNRLLEDREPEHRMRDEHAENAADQLRHDVGGQIHRRESTVDALDHRHSGIEVRAGDGPEHRDVGDQPRARGDRVRKKGQRIIMSQPLTHDAGADDGREQQESPESFGRSAHAQGRTHVHFRTSRQRRASARSARAAASASPKLDSARSVSE
jgi:hypothetical protein